MRSNAERRAGATTRAAVLAAGVALATMLVTTSLRAQNDDLDVLLDRLATYLEKYEGELSTLVADEHYVQNEQRRLRGVLPRTLQRVTDSEVMFLRLPGHAEWFGVRDTRKVDGDAVTGAGITLADLMKQPVADLLDRAAAIVEASSRHNLGGRRTINMPTVPLEALSPRNHPRYIFKVGGRGRVSGVQTRRLEFEEFDEPTLVESTEGGSLWSRGTAWIEPATGALWRAELIVGPDRPGTYRRVNLESRVRVDFARDAALGMIVPRELVETFWVRGGTGSGRGRYSNYRKFSTAARVIPSPLP